jgi:hypothetical protein
MRKDFIQQRFRRKNQQSDGQQQQCSISRCKEGANDTIASGMMDAQQQLLLQRLAAINGDGTGGGGGSGSAALVLAAALEGHQQQQGTTTDITEALLHSHHLLNGLLEQHSQ